MDIASDYRQYARECVDWAEHAETEDQRKSFLHMARMWTQAAAQIEAACGRINGGMPSSKVH